MKSKILDLIKSKPKHFSKLIASNEEMKAWVSENKLITSPIYAAEIYSAVYQTTNICQHGNEKKFKSISVGFVGCGKASSCKCVRDSVASFNSSIIRTAEEKTAIQNKRVATNLTKYGVSNTGQTESAKLSHSEWYANSENVEIVLEKIKQTNLLKYGVENCKSLPEVEQKIIATCLAKYGVTNVAQIPSTKAKLKARTAEYKLTKHLLSKGYDKFKQHILDSYECELITPFSQYDGVSTLSTVDIKCLKCGEHSTVKFYYNKQYLCPHCNEYVASYTSKEEQSVFDFITTDLGIHGIQSDKSIINPYELDMIFPQERIAIEYCGLYWHSESSGGKDKKYHATKLKLAKDAGYRLITIFSDEWNLTKSIVKSKLTNIFKKTSVVHYARKLVVKHVSASDTSEFLDKHHLQGSSSSKINLGLYSSENLVALMTFSNGRAALNTKSVSTEYELVRFVTNGSSVVGGASKLLKYFITKYSPTKITSYADNRWSEGAVYKLLGFKEINDPTVGYWYVDNYCTRIHRFNFTKQALIESGNDPSKTEWEIMKELGYDRIWDCGHQKYVMEL